MRPTLPLPLDTGSSARGSGPWLCAVGQQELLPSVTVNVKCRSKNRSHRRKEKENQKLHTQELVDCSLSRPALWR